MKEHLSDTQREQLQKVVDAQKAEQAKVAAKKDRTRVLSRLIEQQRRKGFRSDDHFVRWTQDNADELLMRGLIHVLGDKAKWLPEYDDVAEWLGNNQGEGLMLIGDCGRGKTVITQQIMPLLFQYYLRRPDGSRMAYNCTTAKELANCFDEFSQYKIICVDDIGTESKVKKYGNTRDYVEDLVDLSEKQHKLLVLSTNLTFEQLQARYDIRTIDRLRSLTHRVFFEGESLRG